MEKEFVTYEQSLALKELGFDEPCMSSRDINNGKGLIQLPLCQQAFRWFRDKYDLWCCIQKYPTSDNPKRCYYELKGDNINTDKDESPNSYMSGWFDSYEEAESACLDKLIEIIKNK